LDLGHDEKVLGSIGPVIEDDYDDAELPASRRPQGMDAKERGATAHDRNHALIRPRHLRPNGHADSPS